MCDRGSRESLSLYVIGILYFSQKHEISIIFILLLDKTEIEQQILLMLIIMLILTSQGSSFHIMVSRFDSTEIVVGTERLFLM